MTKIPTYMLTGFLGSGKTTLIKNLLDEYSQDKKLAVVQNEFAPHNFDGQELKRHSSRDFNLLEINKGSVFCVCLLSDFIQSFSKFIEKYTPDIILFEASGLSDPIAVGELFNSPELQNNVYLAGSICVVDAVNFLKLERLQQRMVHQVQIADTILLNKTDLVDNYQPVMDKLNEINPLCNKMATTYCNVELQIILSQKKINPAIGNLSFQISAEDIGRPDIKSILYRSTKAIRKVNHKQFLHDISSEMIRIKGYILLDSGETLAIQFAGSQLKTEAINRNIKQTELIAMGFTMSPGDLKRLYLQYC